MATTKIWPVKSDLGRVVRYAGNPEKTASTDPMKSVLGYATEITKTEKMLYVSGVNCDPATAKEEMILTKQSWNRMELGRALAFHGIQSFAPGETTPQQAHEIGVEFARRMWGERFQVVVSTHLDKSHLHNHYVVNSISFVDGGRYHDNKKSYYGQIRKISDELCREYGLSVVEKSQGKGKHYAEWKAEKEGKPTIRSQLCAEIDSIIKTSFTFQTFLTELQKRGYAVKYGDNVTHMAVKAKGAQRFFRLKSLGENYSEDAIRQRLARQRDVPESPKVIAKNRRYKPPRPHKKLKGFVALYYRYLYMLGKIKHQKPPKKAVFLLRREVTKLEQYNRQFIYLYKNKLESVEALLDKKQSLENAIARHTEKRQPLYILRREAKDESERAALRFFIRFVGAKTAVTYGMDIMTALFGICSGVITTVAGQMGDITGAGVSLPQEMADEINGIGFLASIPLWLVTLLGSLFVTVLSFVLILTVYARFFRLYFYTALAPIPLASFAGETTSGTGKAFIKSYLGVCMQGAVIVLAFSFQLLPAAPSQ